MKQIVSLFILVLILQQGPTAQTLQKYYDYNWKPCEPNMARFISVIKNTDSGWASNDYFIIEKSLQMKGLFKDSARTIKNGFFYYFHPNGLLESSGLYKDNKKEGLWLSFYDNQYMSDSSAYSNGEPIGTTKAWYNDGAISDSAVYNADGSAVYVEWFDNGNLSSAGRLDSKHSYNGRWQFYHRNGQLSASELYDHGTMVDKKYFSEDGSPMADTTDKWVRATYPGGIAAWSKYLEKQLYFPPGWKIVNSDRAVVVVTFIINESGEVKDVLIKTPFHQAFNRIALLTVKGSQKWKPGINHNRKVRNRWTQTVTFKQQEDQ